MVQEKILILFYLTTANAFEVLFPNLFLFLTDPKHWPVLAFSCVHIYKHLY